MPKEILKKIYNPEDVEEKWVAFWEKRHLFHPSPESARPSFSMVIPPPNITGSLHVGHALNNTLQDILARWKRMSGYNVLWVPGTDHAGIATQNVVERQLSTGGISRHALGREAFIQEVWKWKETSGRMIVGQLKRLGASCDWERERFTLDEGLSRAVREVFVRLYEEGLIYRAERLINWCPRCQTALSDIEVEYEEGLGKLYSVDYPFVDDPSQKITVATTRPETMLGDTAVAVHPEDERYQNVIGRWVHLPLADVEIPIIADGMVDRTFGTGAVKVTPAHDFNDEAMGKRHRLPSINILTPNGYIVEIPRTRRYAGKTILEARLAVVADLTQLGLLRKMEDHRHAVGKCYRCKTVVEPFLSPQWFVRVNDPKNSLAGPAIEVVKKKKVRLIPEGWENNYFGWMEHIQDWCISRQIWWGHQIPAWYCREEVGRTLAEVGEAGFIASPEWPQEIPWFIPKEAKPIVQRSRPDPCPHCGRCEMVQDPDVLDTWFSSALWPFSTLGWPPELQPDPEGRKEAEKMLKTFYPTSTLVTSFDILFFWVARMMMMGLHFMNEVPFKDVYIHALVRDAEGQKMSKSKGNVIDPLEIVNKYGTDALRFTLAAMASPGRDIKLSEERIEGYRNFANKIWNAARFIMMNVPEDLDLAQQEPGPSSPIDQWIQSRLHRTIVSIQQSLKDYRFDEAAQALYQFIWHEFCDWCLEFIKVDLQEQNEVQKRRTYITLTTTFEALLRLLHPFMPFITEELRGHLPREGESLTLASYPQFDAGALNERMEETIQQIINMVVAIRNLRGEMNIPPSEELMVLVNARNQDSQNLFEKYLHYIKRLARISISEIRVGLPRPKGAATVSTDQTEFYIPLDERHLKKEIDRLKKALSKLRKEMEAIEKKFQDPYFTTRAPKEVVAKIERQRVDLYEKKGKLEADLGRIRSIISESEEKNPGD